MKIILHLGDIYIFLEPEVIIGLVSEEGLLISGASVWEGSAAG